MNTRTLDEATRRQRQEAIGLFIQPEMTLATHTKQDDIMQENSVSNISNKSRAAKTLEHLSQPPTFREVAIHEAKKAAFWVPVLATTLLGTLWVNKRFILKAATRV
jgi:hypothetical protein